LTYRLKGLEVLDEWLTVAPDGAREPVFSWLFQLIEGPEAVPSTPVPLGTGLPVYTAIVPATDTAVSWVLVKSPPYPAGSAAVILKRMEQVPPGW